MNTQGTISSPIKINIDDDDDDSEASSFLIRAKF
jgi:hypothetical protein